MSTTHDHEVFSDNGKIIIVKANLKMIRECYVENIKVISYFVKTLTTTTIGEAIAYPKEHREVNDQGHGDTNNFIEQAFHIEFP